MEDKEPKVRNTLANLIQSVCNCVLRQRNHFVSTKMLLISKLMLNAFQIDDPIWNDYRLFHNTIYHMKSWNLGKGKGKKATIIIHWIVSIIQNILSV